MIVRLFQKQFWNAVRDGVKCQTVRPKPTRERDVPKPGQVISCRRWTGRPYGSKQEVLRESFVLGTFPAAIGRQGVTARDPRGDYVDTEEFALNDGFSSYAEMLAWFEKTHDKLPFSGIVIYWAQPAVVQFLGRLVTLEKDYALTKSTDVWPKMMALSRAGLVYLTGGDLNGMMYFRPTTQGMQVLKELARSSKG